MGSLATPFTNVRPVYCAGIVSVASASPPVSTMLVMMGEAWTLGMPSTTADRIKVSNRLVGFMLLLLLWHSVACFSSSWVRADFTRIRQKMATQYLHRSAL